MYVPRHFSMTPDQVRALLADAGAGDLVTHDPTDGLTATYLPWLYDPTVGEHGALLGHLTRVNTQWRHQGSEVLVILHGPHHYISPTWFPEDETSRVVPTWNYVTVHAHGDLVAHDDPEWTRDVVRRMSAHHETAYSLDDLPADAVDRMLRAIVGIEVRITRLEAKAKMSQNKMPHDVAAIIDGLRAEGAGDVADWMAEVSLPAAERRADLIDDVARRHRAREERPRPV